jgi:hypothetical protein
MDKLIASLRSAPAGSPQIDSWFAFGTPNGAQSIEKVRAIDRERVSCGGAGSYLRSRLSGKRVHLLDPVRHGPAVARLLEQSVADDSGEPFGPESLPCARCPVLDTCSVAANGLASANRALAVSQQELRKIDPEARVLTLARALRQLGALDEQDHLTDLGRALRNLHGRAGLFFALARGRLADLSPEGLALVVGATREVRVGYVPARTDLLPAYFVEEVNRAIAAETAAGGMDRLVPLGIDAQRQSVDGSGRSAVRPSFSDRRAFVLERLWSGREVDEVGISPGDAERLLLDTLAFLGNLEGIPELHGAARQASEHLRSIAGHVPE